MDLIGEWSGWYFYLLLGRLRKKRVSSLEVWFGGLEARIRADLE